MPPKNIFNLFTQKAMRTKASKAFFAQKSLIPNITPMLEHRKLAQKYQSLFAKRQTFPGLTKGLVPEIRQVKEDLVQSRAFRTQTLVKNLTIKAQVQEKYAEQFSSFLQGHGAHTKAGIERLEGISTSFEKGDVKSILRYMRQKETVYKMIDGVETAVEVDVFEDLRKGLKAGIEDLENQGMEVDIESLFSTYFGKDEAYVRNKEKYKNYWDRVGRGEYFTGHDARIWAEEVGGELPKEMKDYGEKRKKQQDEEDEYYQDWFIGLFDKK